MRVSAIKKRLGDLLVDVGIISALQLKEALDAQKRNGGKLGTILSQMGLINEEVMLAFLGKQCGVSYVSLAEYGDIPNDVTRIIPESIVRHQNLIPISKDDKVLTIAMADPFNVFAIDDIKMITGYDVQVVIASESEITAAIEKYYSKNGIFDSIAASLPAPDRKSSPEKESAIIEKAVLTPLFSDAARAGATKIFFEPQESFMSVRYRIDGYLSERSRFPKELSERVSAYFLSRGKQAEEKTLFAEYETKIEINDKKTKVLLRVIPTIFGDSISASIENELAAPQELGELGFEPETLSVFRKNIETPGGLILITGPAGSGKSLTMYSAMKALNYTDRKILSFAERAEYAVNGVTQVVTEGNAPLDRDGLAEILNAYEPDIVFIENMLEGGNAGLAVDTALTGHTVFSTMNSNSALDAVSKLLYAGVAPSLLASCLVMISSQRLMRVICAVCKETYELPAGILKPFGYEHNDADETAVKLKRSSGCPECGNTGYRGRTAVFEITEPNEKMKTLIAEKNPESALKEYYAQKKLLTFSEAALRKVISGSSSVEEFLRLIR